MIRAKALGTYAITVIYTPDPNYTVTVVNGTLTILRVPVNPTPTPTQTATPTPTATIVPGPDVPTTGPGGPIWALLNLILTIGTALVSLILLLEFSRKNEETVSESDTKRKGFMRLLSLVPAVGAIIAFILTEDMRNPMVFTDQWTLLMIGIAAVQAVVLYLAHKDSTDTEDAQPQDA